MDLQLFDGGGWEQRKKEIAARLKGMSVDELKIALAKKLTYTAESYFEAAMIMRELEESHGIDMQPIAGSWATVLRKIAYGQIIPELLVYCGGKTVLLSKASMLPIPQQRQLVDSQGFELVEGNDKRIVDPRYAEPWQIRQLFAPDRIRQPHEQRQWLAGQEQKRHRRVRPAVSRASDLCDDEMTVTITVAISPEWDTAIRIMAKENSLPVKHASRRFLIALGKK